MHSGLPSFTWNGDDPEAVLFVTSVSSWISVTNSKKDVVIDLICYRRRRHNENCELQALKPLMYTQIRQQKDGLRTLYCEKAYGRFCPKRRRSRLRWNTSYRKAQTTGAHVCEFGKKSFSSCC